MLGKSKVNKHNIRLIIETVFVWMVLSFLALTFSANRATIFIFAFAQGLWFYRFYIVGHEASHVKLFPENKFLNDLAGNIILLPLCVPLRVYRKIHMFHHGYNRRDSFTSALDTFVVYTKPSIFKKIWYHFLWYFNILGGGFFLHSLISVLLFLFVPVRFSRKISPAFNGWKLEDQIRSLPWFLIGLGMHILTFIYAGSGVYWTLLGYPTIAFAFILSLLVYMFHYDTSTGHEVRYHVRSLKPVPVLSWVLMNFNEHATHHQYPNIPWFELPFRRASLPEEYHRQNQNTDNFFKAVFQQLKGPTIILLHDTKSPHQRH